MFIDEKRFWVSRSSEIERNAGHFAQFRKEEKMGARASYKHFAATRLFFRRTRLETRV